MGSPSSRSSPGGSPAASPLATPRAAAPPDRPAGTRPSRAPSTAGLARSAPARLPSRPLAGPPPTSCGPPGKPSPSPPPANPGSASPPSASLPSASRLAPAPPSRPPAPWPPGGPAAGSSPVTSRPARRRPASRARTRCPSSAAALRVKVRPRTRSGRTMPLATSQTSRAAIVSLLPEPAPAMTASGSSGAAITSACSAVGSGSPSSRARCPGSYRTVLMASPAGHRARGARTAARARGAPGSTAHRRSRAPGSPGHLLAVGVDGAAGPDRAVPASWVHPRLEQRARHARRHGLDQVACPVRFRVVGQRLLRLHPDPGGQARVAHLDQLCPARLGQAEPLERPEQDGELVHAELGVPVQVRGRHRGGPGLQVHDDGPAVGVPLQPVHPAGDLHGADLGLQLLLDRDQFPRVVPVPGEELVHHDRGPLPLLLAVPGAAEVQVMPDLVDPVADHGRVGAGGGEHGGRVDEDPEVPDHVRGPGARGDLEQPAQPAPVERLDLGW